jgi:hypothetical protein
MMANEKVTQVREGVVSYTQAPTNLVPPSQRPTSASQATTNTQATTNRKTE